MSFELTIRGETLEELKLNLMKFFDDANKPTSQSKPATPPRKKVFPGDADVTLKEVQAYLAKVKLDLGDKYVDIIIERIPVAGIASLKPSEFHRCIRLCQHYLNEPIS